jgi:cytochrome P450
MVLRRYREVAAALRDSAFQIVGGSVDPIPHRAMRDQARELYGARQWPEPPPTTPSTKIEIVQDFAEPWSLAVASLVTGIDPRIAPQLIPAARAVFDAGASPDPGIQANEAARTLAGHFPPPIAALHVQAFVALTVSLPAFLGNACAALLANAEQFDSIGERTAIDELLRFAGPSIRQLRIRNGERVELRLAEANRDPDEFPDPNRLDLKRRNASAHLAFGGGPHACVGGPLVKSAVAAILPVFSKRFAAARLIDSQPYGGPAILGHRVWLEPK